MGASLGTALRDEIRHLLAPVVGVTASPQGAARLLSGLGYTDEVATRGDLATAITNLTTALDAITAIDDLESWDGIRRLLEEIARIGDTIDALGTSGVASLGRELGEQLVSTYLRGRFPRLFRLASLLTLIDPAEAMPALPSERDAGGITRLPRRVDRLRFDRGRALLSAPLETLADVYLPNGLATAADAHTAAARVFEPLVRLLTALGVFTRVDVVDTEPPPPPSAPSNPEADTGDHGTDEAVDSAGGSTDEPPSPPPDLTAYYRRFQPRLIAALPMPDGPAQVGVAIIASSPEHPDQVAGFVVGLVGALALAQELAAWQLTFAATGDVPAFVVGPGEIALAPGTAAGEEAGVALVLQRRAEGTGPAFVLGAATGTRLELGAVIVRLDATLRAEQPSLALTFDTRPSAFVLAAGDGDGFLRRVMSGEVRIPLDVGLVLSSDGGLRLLGGAGLATRGGGSVALGPVTLSGPSLAVTTVGDSLRLAATCELTVTLGPLRVGVTGLGLALDMQLPASGGPWPASLDVGFVPPAGALLAVESALVHGGGFLRRDPARGRYLGAVSLRIGALEVGGAGVLDPQLPDGGSGYSLAAIGAARFPRVQLGWGFTLDGLGVFIGVHRTVDVEALRAGVRGGALQRLLAPGDPVAEAPAIVDRLARFFPPRQGRYIVGPTARIGWGTPAILQADLALLFELPSPVRVIALAAVQVGLPTLERRIVDLRMDVLGVLDLERKLLAVDASLHHSTLAGYPLTGDMALRTSWGDDPHFLLAIGGFHPRFTPPAGFPTLRRVALTIGDNPRLRLEAYVALTSSTVQLGASVDLDYRAAGLKIGGHLQFDALVELRPLYLEAALEAKVGISYRGHNIASARLDFVLRGPRPWHARGTATIGVLLWDVSVGFDVTWGERIAPALPPPPEVAQLLREALTARSAWSADLAPAERGWLVLRDPSAGPAAARSELRFHPFGHLTVRQRVIPLGLSISAFGNAPLPRAERFAIRSMRVGAAAPAATTPVQDSFAPAQFAILRPHERLAAPSFESLTSGARMQGAVALGTTARVSMDHDTTVQDPLAPTRRSPRATVSAAVLAAATAQRAVGREPRPPVGAVRLHAPRFVLASTRDLSITALGARVAAGETSYAALRQARQVAIDDRGDAVRELQIIPRAETTTPTVDDPLG